MYRKGLVVKLTLQKKRSKPEDIVTRRTQHESEELNQAKTKNRREKFQKIKHL